MNFKFLPEIQPGRCLRRDRGPVRRKVFPTDSCDDTDTAMAEAVRSAKARFFLNSVISAISGSKGFSLIAICTDFQSNDYQSAFHTC